ncbi:heavy-metal-associated domain-containing protein [Spongiivirga citrea]|uniref:Copper chaperone n=1 Tax=Spongiivirga citrea TaxID=1481457 RepID=A0A6M0CH56_9FLAO|nr:heavy-metal-associated domain-containing protein [Spongiivirga citrea]NER16293.1 copper chaperone [Spongiivirga citrea]
MKKIVIIIFAVLMVVPAMNMSAQKSFDQFEVQVDGLGCPFCAYGLEKKFKEFKGIKKVKIDIETGDFSFAYPTEKALSLDAVTQQVNKAGYTPMSGKVTRADGTIEEISASNLATINSNESTKQAFVAGNCEMCEARINKAALSVAGVLKSNWDRETKMLEVSFNSKQTNLKKIEKAIAKAGHDTKNHKAKADTYGELPGCCKYERIE